MPHPFIASLAVIVALTACAEEAASPGVSAPLPSLELESFLDALASSDRPVVVNLWASWCIPCRSEAPLLRRAHAEYGDRVWFVGIATEDFRADSAAFIAEFDLRFEHLSDPEGRFKAWAGATGLPVTLFVLPGGEILRTHFGAIDDAALALGIDDLLTTG